jgi:hypothetical protein
MIGGAFLPWLLANIPRKSSELLFLRLLCGVEHCYANALETGWPILPMCT